MASLPNPFENPAASDAAAGQAAACLPQPPSQHAAADQCHIGEIFVGAAKLFDPDPVAYTSADQAYFDLLKQIDKPETPDLREMPYGFDDSIFDPPPLFLQIAV